MHSGHSIATPKHNNSKVCKFSINSKFIANMHVNRVNITKNPTQKMEAIPLVQIDKNLKVHCTFHHGYPHLMG